MDIIKFTVKGQHMILNTDLRKVRVTSDTISYFKCQFTFDSSWDGFEKRIYFKNASFNIMKSALPDASGYCYIPWEVLAHTGVILCNAAGTKYSGTDVAERLTTDSVKFFLRNTSEGIFKPDDSATPTLSEYEQFVGQVRSYSQQAIAAKNAAELAQNKIKNMTATAVGGEEGTQPSVQKTEFDDHFNLEFTIPKGDAGVAGPQGPRGVQGDRGEQGYTPYVQNGYWYVNGVNTGHRAIVTDYEELSNKPQIEGVTLVGDLSFEDLELENLTNSEIEELTDVEGVTPIIVDPDEDYFLNISSAEIDAILS